MELTEKINVQNLLTNQTKILYENLLNKYSIEILRFIKLILIKLKYLGFIYC